MDAVLTIALTAFVVLYAQRDWFVALCCVVVFTTVQDYPRVPNPFGVAGLTPWSVMLLGALLGWAVDRLTHPRPWPIPRAALLVFGIYCLGELLAIGRLCLHLDTFVAKASVYSPSYTDYTVRGALVDHVYAPVRYMVIGFLMADGLTSRRRIVQGLVACLLAGLVYALIIMKEIPVSALGADGMEYRHRIQRWTSRHPNDLADIFVTAFWVCVWVAQTRTFRWRMRGAFAGALLPFALALGHTCSRGGYLGFVACGLFSAVATRSWKMLLMLGVVAAAVVTLAPSVTGRILAGVDTNSKENSDTTEITGGRDTIWPAALKGIEASPLVGWGFFGYVVSPALDHSAALDGGELHPHNAYLQCLLDHGWVGAWMRLLPFLYVLVCSWRLLWTTRDAVLHFAGAAGFAATVTLMVMGLTGQSFGFTENLFIYWFFAGATIGAWGLVQARAAQAAAARDSAPRRAPGRRSMRTRAHAAHVRGARRSSIPQE